MDTTQQTGATTESKRIKSGLWYVRTPEALAAARVLYPDARRATLTRETRDRAKDLIGQTIRAGGEPVRILRCEVEDINAQWGEGDDAGYGYRLHLIVSATAAAE